MGMAYSSLQSAALSEKRAFYPLVRAKYIGHDGKTNKTKQIKPIQKNQHRSHLSLVICSQAATCFRQKDCRRTQHLPPDHTLTTEAEAGEL